MEKETLKFEMKKRDNIAIFTINSTRLDSSKAPQLKTEFLRLISEDYKNIIVNLVNVESIDSSGLGALLFGLRQSTNKNGNLKLVGLQSKVSSLLKISKLDRVLEVFEDEENCIKSFY
ncbi:anti-anti-sigma factor [candidate division KSB1 bacterium]|nr:MAG: anti-anti-sigma factor [candidate division KSB1 bacterium]